MILFKKNIVDYGNDYTVLIRIKIVVSKSRSQTNYANILISLIRVRKTFHFSKRWLNKEDIRA